MEEVFPVDTGDQISAAAFQVNQGFRTHRFRDLNGRSYRYVSSILYLVAKMLRANAKDDILVDVLACETFQTALQRESEPVLLRRLDKEQTTVALLNLPFKQVHWRTTNKSGNEKVVRLTVEG